MAAFFTQYNGYHGLPVPSLKIRGFLKWNDSSLSVEAILISEFEIFNPCFSMAGPADMRAGFLTQPKDCMQIQVIYE